jgi:hypothetical protein
MKYIVLQITDLLYIKYESKESIVVQSTHLTNYWMETTRGHVKYNWKKVGGEIYVQQFNPERKKYGIQELTLKIDHNISGTKGPNEKCKNNKIIILKVAENSIIVAEEIMIMTWDMG